MPFSAVDDAINSSEETYNKAVDIVQKNLYPDIDVEQIKTKVGGRKPIIVTNPNDPRLRAFNDSNDLYRSSQEYLPKYLNLAKKLNVETEEPKDELNPLDANNFINLYGNSGTKHFDNTYNKGKYYKSINYDNNAPIGMINPKLGKLAGIGTSSEEYGNSFTEFSPVNKNTGTVDDVHGFPTRRIYQQELASQLLAGVPIYKKPVQPVVYQKPNNEITPKPIITPKPKPKTNFEQRIANPTETIKNADGTESTHKMMSFEADGKFYAAPTIVKQNGKLVELSPKDAIDYAFKNKEFKEFKTDQEARDYANNGYKKGTLLEEHKFEPDIVKMNSDPDYDKTKFYQGYDFMQQTGLKGGYYTIEQIKEALKKKGRTKLYGYKID